MVKGFAKDQQVEVQEDLIITVNQTKRQLKNYPTGEPSDQISIASILASILADKSEAHAWKNSQTIEGLC